MPATTIRLLLIEDSDPDADLVAIGLEKAKRFAFELVRARDLAAAGEILSQDLFDVVLTDLDLPDMRGMESFREVKRLAPTSAIIVITGYGNDEIGTQAMREGAQEYLHKAELEPGILERAIVYALERTRTQLDIVRSERMASVATLIQGVSHQFNNLLAVIGGYLELVTGDPQLADKHRRRLTFAREAVRKASAITHSLRIFSGEEPGPAAPVNLAAIADAALDMLRVELENEGVRTDTAGGETPVFAMANRERLLEVVLQLMINARHALLDREEKRIRLSWEQRGARVCLRVEDTGCGIAPENLSRVFTPFYSTKGELADSQSPQVKVRGVGLGLTFCQSILENYGGRIDLRSTPGRGTTATICLPAAEAPAPAATWHDEPATARRGRLLVLEDNESMAELLSDVLTEAGHEVSVYTRSREAVDALRGGRYEAMLLDIKMSGMNGYEVLEVLQTLPALHRPRVIVVTGVPLEEAGDRCLELGAMDVIAKPFKRGALLAAVQRALA